jgi:hypothetical protein
MEDSKDSQDHYYPSLSIKETRKRCSPMDSKAIQVDKDEWIAIKPNAYKRRYGLHEYLEGDKARQGQNGHWTVRAKKAVTPSMDKWTEEAIETIRARRGVAPCRPND